MITNASASSSWAAPFHYGAKECFSLPRLYRQDTNLIKYVQQVYLLLSETNTHLLVPICCLNIKCKFGISSNSCYAIEK